MKYGFVALALLLFSFCHSAEIANNKTISESSLLRVSPKLFKIGAIDSTKQVYTIIAVRNDSIFKIISPIEKSVGCRRIKIKENYQLLLRSVFPKKALGGVDISPGANPHIKDFVFYDKVFHLEAGDDLYRSDNLRGLCLQ